MRTYHRWLSVLFGLFILFIAITGVLSQIGSLVNNGGFEQETRDRGARQASAVGNAIVAPAQAHEESEATPAAATTSAAACPADMTCRPKRVAKPGDWNVGFLHHIHSGEQFGPVGVIISILSGIGLIFFAISGMWMYLQMFRARNAKSTTRKDRHGGKFFW